MDNDVLVQLREHLVSLYEELTAIKESSSKDHETEAICTGYSDYQKENPGVILNRAEKRIARKGYNICLAGGFSGGKSTLINALLEEPGLLAAEAGECTMSITSVTAPAPGEEERIAVTYFPKEEAVKNVVQNTRYFNVFGDIAEKLINETDVDKVIGAVKEGAAALLKESDTEQRKRGSELEEFVECLNTFEDRLGKEHSDSISNSKVYLTTDKDDKGLGHLMLIEQVAIYRNNRLFVENGIRIVDLPGTDSPNERQKELTHQAMAEADVLLLTLEPKGFKMADVLIGKELGKHYNTIKNKVFIIVNKFDTLDSSDIAKNQIEKLYKGQMMEQIIKAGFNPERVYFTSSKFSLLNSMKEQNRLTSVDQKELEAMKTSIEGKQSGLDKDIIPEIIEKIERCYKDGGVNYVREQLIKYLEYNVQLERLSDINGDLMNVYEITKKLLDPERGKIEDVLEKQKNISSRIIEFVDEVQQMFDDSLVKFEVNMDKAVKKLMGQVYDKVNSFGQLIDKLNFEKIESTVNLPNTHKIKLAIIDTCKEKFGETFSSTVLENTVFSIAGLVKQELDKTNVEKICNHFSDDRVSFGEQYRTLYAEFEDKLKFIAGLRINEEAERIAKLDVTPSGAPTGPWGVEEKKAFRDDLKKLFSDKYSGAVKTLEVVLPGYFTKVLESMREGFAGIISDMTQVIRGAEDVDLPLDLIYQEDSSDMNIKKKIVTYIMHLDKAVEIVGAVKGLGILK